MSYVLDASALLTLAFGEPGAEIVAARLKGALLGATNYAEVIAKLVDRGLPLDEAIATVEILGIEIVPLTASQALLSAEIRPVTRAAGLSLGDRACLALARERGLPAVTAERRWPEVAAAANVAVELIR